MPTLALVLLSALQDPVYSGPQKGEKLPGFKVLHMNGEMKDAEIDFVADGKGASALIVFVHELTRPGAQVMRKLDEHAAKRGVRGLIVLLPEDLNKSERYAPLLQSIMKYKSALGISVDGKEGPGGYGLNHQVTLTILLAKQDVVAANWALRSPSDTDTPAILKAIDDLVGFKEEPKQPTGDLEARVAALEKEIRELRAMIERLTRQPPPPAGGERKPPLRCAPPSDPTLNGLMRRMIRPETPNEEVDKAIGEIEAHVKDNADLKKQARDGITLILDLKYGTEYARTRAQELLSKLAE